MVWQSFILVPNSSQGTVGYEIEVCATLQGYASRDHHWPTTKLVMLDDVTGSITFTTVSPDSFTPVTYAQCEPALICEENGVDQPILVFSGECQSSCRVQVWAQVPLEDVGLEMLSVYPDSLPVEQDNFLLYSHMRSFRHYPEFVIGAVMGIFISMYNDKRTQTCILVEQMKQMFKCE